MKIDSTWLRNFILSTVKPLKSVTFESQPNDTSASCSGLVPDGGTSDKFRLTSPFGLVSGITQGCAAFYQGNYASGFESIILGIVHLARPSVNPGQAILYSTDASGATIKATVKLNPDGSIDITAPSAKVTVIAQEVDIGSGALKKALVGEIFQMTYNQHTHEDSIGGLTSPPTTPSASGDLSTILKTV
jgi:hypothetical protein